jgi:hypothetical protein
MKPLHSRRNNRNIDCDLLTDKAYAIKLNGFAKHCIHSDGM